MPKKKGASEMRLSREIPSASFSAPDQGLFNFSVKGVVSPWPEKPGL